MTDALIGDTQDLSTEEFGAYLLILIATWRNNGKALVDDDKRLARITRVGSNRFSTKIKPRLSQFFDISDGYWHQKRLEIMWKRASNLSKMQREKGLASAEARRLKSLNGAATAVATAVPTNYNYNLKKEDIKKEDIPPIRISPLKRGERLPDGWEPSHDDKLVAEKFGLDPEETLAAFTDYWCAIPGQKGCKLDWSATWRTWCRRAWKSPNRNGSNGQLTEATKRSLATRKAAFEIAERMDREREASASDLQDDQL